MKTAGKTSFPKASIRVVLLEGIHPRGAELLRQEGFQVELLPKALEGSALHKAIAGAHVLGIRSKTQVDAAALKAAQRLLAVGCFCIGTNQVDLSSACQAGVPVFNSPFSNTRSVAELTIAEAIALCRQMTEKSRKMHAGEWDKSAEGSHEVRGRTIGIVGYGRIGSQVSVLAEAMGMRVVFYDILPRLALGNARGCRSLGELLEQSDIVTLHVPATDQTEGMIGKAELRKMKKGAMLINNARGGVVDIPALAAALSSGHLSGAALDVFPVEPVGKGEPFKSEVCGLPNVILTPHVGGSTEEAQESIAEDVATKFIKFVNVGTTTGAVNVPEVELPPQAERDGPGKGPRRHRILHFHRNVPGVLSAMHGEIARLGANISAEYLQTNKDIGYVVLDVDPTDGSKVMESVRSIPETIRVRMLW
ncbi:MAG: D-3-phosphoglycerate dehydrogenase [Phycisphaerales bacterium]|nr:D-3-phosphoglycerate dehydrogenase [Phycisphaerales bacterium]